MSRDDMTYVLRRCALDAMKYIPEDRNDALTILAMMRELVDWATVGEEPRPTRVVQLVRGDDPPAA